MHFWNKLLGVFCFVAVAAFVIVQFTPPASGQASTTMNRIESNVRWLVGSSGSLDVESGGEIDVESGGSLKLAGTAVTATAAELNLVDGIATALLSAPAGTTLTIGASPAATCTAGSIHIDTDESVDTNCTTTADNSVCLCTAADTWTAHEN
jgi:hypothetical protein